MQLDCWKACETVGQHPKRMQTDPGQKIGSVELRFPAKPRPFAERRVFLNDSGCGEGSTGKSDNSKWKRIPLEGCFVVIRQNDQFSLTTSHLIELTVGGHGQKYSTKVVFFLPKWTLFAVVDEESS